MKRNILLHANELIHGERVQTYGAPHETFPDIARLASELCQKELTVQDIVFVNLAQKIVRDRTSPDNPDHLTDACGYLGILDDHRQSEENNDRTKHVHELQTTSPTQKGGKRRG